MGQDFDKVTGNLTQGETWLRILFMVGFSVALYVVAMVLLFVTVVQALFAVVTGADNGNLRTLGANLADYVNQILRFLTYNSQTRPFPFSPFPDTNGAPRNTGDDGGATGESETGGRSPTGPESDSEKPGAADNAVSRSSSARNGTGDGIRKENGHAAAGARRNEGRQPGNGSARGLAALTSDAGDSERVFYTPAAARKNDSGTDSKGDSGQQSASLTLEEQTMSKEQNTDQNADKPKADESKQRTQLDPAGLAGIEVKKSGSRKNVSGIFSDLEFNRSQKGGDSADHESDSQDRD